MKSWKIGAVAGLIAGIVAGIIYDYFAKISASIGFWIDPWPQAVSNSFVANVLISIIFGIVIGVIFSEAYDILPGKGNLKGLYFGLIIFFIFTIRDTTFGISYAYIPIVLGRNFTDFPKLIVYGMMLGFIYESLHKKYNIPKKEKKVIQYDSKGGILPGAIAGLIGGIAASFANIMGSLTGIFGAPFSPSEVTFDFWLSQSGAHILMNMVWGIIFGIMFTKFYNLVPGKGAIKGLFYGLLIFLITSFYHGVMHIGWGMSSSSWLIIVTGLWILIVGIFQILFFGLVLGLLYRKPSK